MPRQAFRVAAATGEIALGLPAVVLFASAMVYLIDSSDVDNSRGILVGVAFVLGAALFFIWLYARTRRRLLITLAACAGVLFAVTTMIAIVLYRPSRFDALRGLWGAPSAAGLDVLLWLAIMIIAIIELRLIGKDDELTMPGWAYLPSIVAPLAFVVALTIMILAMMPSWLIRLNSTVGGVSNPQRAQGSELSGGSRWTRGIDGEKAIATSYGIAVPVDADGSHSAGIIMIDATTGKQLWRYQLHGTADAPQLQVTDNGNGIVIDLAEEDHLSDQIPGRTYVIDAATGKVRGVWPDTDEVAGTDPPVLFKHVAQGANSVIALTPSGHKLWTYHPDSCADPRSVTSTPKVMLVRARRCGADIDQHDLLGLDAKTGDKLWTRPIDDGSGESSPVGRIVRSDFQIELGGSTVPELARRNLANGAISWKTSVGQACNSNDLTAGGRTAYLTICQKSQHQEPNEIVGYDLQTGQQVMQHKIIGGIITLGGVNDRTALAVVNHGKTCRLERFGPTTRTLLTLPNEKATDQGKVATCGDAQLLHVGTSWVLQIWVRDNSGTVDGSYRFIGLN